MKEDSFLIERLSSIVNIQSFEISNKESVTIDDIFHGIKDGVVEIEESYGNFLDDAISEKRSLEWHVGRVLFFINHPKFLRKITIELDSLHKNNILIFDGFHRLMAAYYLYLQKKKRVIYGICYGIDWNKNLYNYITGKSNTFSDMSKG